MTSQEKRLARILDHHARSAEKIKRQRLSGTFDVGYSVLEHEKERKRRLKMLRDSDSNIYSTNNKSTINANQTMKAIFASINEKNKEKIDLPTVISESKPGQLFMKKTTKKENPGKYQPLDRYQPPTDDDVIQREKKDLILPIQSPIGDTKFSFQKPRIVFADETPMLASLEKIPEQGNPLSLKEIEEGSSDIGFQLPLDETTNQLRGQGSKGSAQDSKVKESAGFSALAANYTDFTKKSGKKKDNEIRALLSVYEASNQEGSKASKKITSEDEKMSELPLYSPSNQAKTVQYLKTAGKRDQSPRKGITKRNSDRLMKDHQSPKGSKSVKSKATIQMFSQADIEQAYQRFHAEKVTVIGLHTVRDMMNPRKELQLLKAFVQETASKFKKNQQEQSRTIQLLENLELFTANHFSTLLRSEMKDYEDIFQVIEGLNSLIATGKAQQAAQKQSKLKDKISLLQRDLALKKDEEENEAKLQTSVQLPVFEEGGEEVQKKTSSMMKTIENLKEEIETLTKMSNTKDRKTMIAMNKLHEKLKYFKTLNNSLVDKYNKQAERMNLLKQRVLYYARKHDPTAEPGDPEEVIGNEILKAMEDDDPSIAQAESVLSEKDEEHGGMESMKQIPGGGGAIMVVDTIDTFDYSQFYNKRNVVRKSHSQRKNPNTYYKDSQHFKYYKEIIQIKDEKQDTKGLILLNEEGTQPIVSFADPKYDNIVQNQYELESYRKRIEFERSVLLHLSDRRHMCFISDKLMRNLLGLNEVAPLPAESDESIIEIDKSELIDHVRDHQVRYHFEDEKTFNTELKKTVKENYFRLDLVDQYIKHMVRIPLPISESMVKYLFLSYVFSIQTMRQKSSLIERRENQVEVLFRLCQTYKSKIKDYDSLLKKTQADIQSFIQIHRGCNMSHLQQDFKYVDKQSVKSDQDVLEQKHVITFATIINKVKKMKSMMKMTSKKYFSFKIAYQKIYLFFQLRSTEVEFIDGPSIRHNLAIEEHFFRFLTEKDNGIRKIEEKIKNYIVTLYNLDSNPKMEIFKSFANMSSTFPYGRLEEYFYLKAIDFIRQESRGLEIQPDYHLGLNYVPFEKMEAYVQKFVIPRISPRSANILWKSLKDLINLNTEYIAKKGVVEFDAAMLHVLKWINTKTVNKFDPEYCFFLFDMLDLDRAGSLTFKDFNYVYKLFNLDVYGESTRLLCKMRSETIKQTLDNQEFEEGMMSPALDNEGQPIKPWMASNYIYSEIELREIFAKYTEQNFRETEDMPGKMEISHFTAMVNDYENLFDFERVYSFLNIKGDNVENDFYLALNDFLDSMDLYTNFVNECKIKENQWKDSLKMRIKDFKAVFQNRQQLTEEMNALVANLAQSNIENVHEDKLMNHLMTKALLAYKIFLLDLMQVDFEQRLDFAQAKALPFDK